MDQHTPFWSWHDQSGADRLSPAGQGPPGGQHFSEGEDCCPLRPRQTETGRDTGCVTQRARTTVGGRNGARTSQFQLELGWFAGEMTWFLLRKHHGSMTLWVPPNPCGSHLPPVREAEGSYSLPGSFRLSTTGRYTSLSRFSSSGVRSTVSW